MKVNLGDIVVIKDSYFKFESLVSYFSIKRDDIFRVIKINEFTLVVEISNIENGSIVKLTSDWLGDKKDLRRIQINRILNKD